MNRSANPIADILQLLLLLVFLPFILLVLGPVLVIAALFGRFSLGALKIRPGKYHPRGRLWALVLGLFVWGLTWGGLAWFWPSNLFQPAITPSPINTITQNTVTPTHTPTNVPSANTSTPAQPTQRATPTATTTATPLPSPTETTAPPPPPTPTLTLTSLPATPTPTPTAVLPTATPSSLQPDDPDQLLTIANDSLVQYLEGGAIDDLSVLGGLWAGEALPAVQSFGRQINLKYQQPLSVTYQLIGSPSLTPLAENRIIVQVRELWVFEDSTHRQESLSDYDYTLQLVEGQWRIVAYQFQALPLPTTAIPISNTGIISQTDDGP
jgi:hypothetical protein